MRSAHDWSRAVPRARRSITVLRLPHPATALLLATGALATGALAACQDAPTAPTAPAAAQASQSARRTRPTLHELFGMAAQVNTGPMWTIPSPISVFSPRTMTRAGEWRGNLSRVSDGSGLRITYRPSLKGGNSPVRFGVSVPRPGTGWFYLRMRVRFSSNWHLPKGNVDVKLCEPRTENMGNVSGPAENHNVDAFLGSRQTDAFLTAGLQGPYSHYRNMGEQPSGNRTANLAGGAWHTVEVLFGPESRPGAGNGSYQAWVDGTPVADYHNVLWLAAGNRTGWRYLMFDPTYGGGIHSPQTTMHWDLDQLYVSTK